MSDAKTLPESVTNYFGVPGPDVTHWGMMKRDARNKEERLTAPTLDGAHTNTWPLSELSVEEVRNRWGDGSYRTFWVIEDPDAALPEQRRRSGGRGRDCRIVGNAAAQWGTPPAMPQLPPAPAGSMMSEVERMAMTMQIMGSMFQQFQTTAPKPDDKVATLMASVAEMKARLEHDTATRALEDKHRRELDEYRDKVRARDQKIERLETQIDEKDPVKVDPDDGVWDVLKKHIFADPKAAFGQFVEFLKSSSTMLQMVTQATQQAQQAQLNPAPAPAAASVVRPRAQRAPHLQVVDAPAAAAPPSTPPKNPGSLSEMAEVFGEKRKPSTVESAE